jgi:KRAB domain-containing zinc finger protein
MPANGKDLVMNIKTEKVDSESEPEVAAASASIEGTPDVKSDPERQWLECLNNDEIKKEPLGRTCEKCGRVTMVKNHKCQTRCKICDKKLSKKSYLIKHMQNVHRAEPDSEYFDCDFCGLRLLQKHFLIRHLKLKHEGGKIEDFQCDYDGKIFTSKVRLCGHMINCHRAAAKCEICGKVVRCMKSHVRMVHPAEKMKIACKICSKTFKNKELLACHLKMHNKQFKCHVCDRKLSTPTGLKIHLKIHNNFRDLQCRICFKGFNYSSNLTTHMRTHDQNKSKSHRCEHCDYATDTKKNLKYHLTVHDENRIRDFKCTKCDYATDDKKSLRTHIEIHNPHRTKFPCPHCDHKATRKCHLKKHITRMHDKKKK